MNTVTITASVRKLWDDYLIPASCAGPIPAQLKVVLKTSGAPYLSTNPRLAESYQ